MQKDIPYVFRRLSLALLVFYCPMTVFSQSRVTISGFVKELTSHELLSGVDVYVAGTANNVVTNAYGFYSLTVFTNLTIALTWRCGFTKN